MRIAVIAVPYDAGRLSEGTGLGPAALLEAGLTRGLRDAGHDVREATVELPLDTPRHELARIVATQRQLAHLVREAIANGELPVVLAGNCSSAVGTLSARPRETGVVWFDAHGDLNTLATTTTGMIDGAALSMVTGRECGALLASVPGFSPVPESQVLLIGARDLDPAEDEHLRSSSIRRLGVDTASREVAGLLRQLGRPVPPVYIHLDLDVLDPAEARANVYAAPGGFSTAALCQALQRISEVAPVYAIAITAYDPAWDEGRRARHAALAALHAIVPGAQTAE
jgi:arginase